MTFKFIRPEEFDTYYKDADIYIAGTFNNWTPVKLNEPLSINLEDGRVCFKYIVNGIWKCSTNFLEIADSDGNINNYIDIEHGYFSFDYMNMCIEIALHSHIPHTKIKHYYKYCKPASPYPLI